MKVMKPNISFKYSVSFSFSVYAIDLYPGIGIIFVTEIINDH